MFTQPVIDRGRAAIATLLAFLLVVAGAIIAPAAHAAAPALSASAAPRAGGTVTVTGTGFAGEAPGIYIAVGPTGLPGFYQGSAQHGDTVWVAPGNADGSGDGGRTAPMSEDGSFSVQLTVPAYAEGAQYALYTSKAHGQGIADPSQNATLTLEWEAEPEPEPEPEPTETETPTPTPTPTPGETDAPAVPSVSVSKSSGLDRDGETITVTGSGFVPAAGTTGTRPPLAGKFGGAYVVFGKFADAWRPSEGVASSARTVIEQRWGVSAEDFGGSVNAGNGGFVIAADGSFEIELSVSASEANELLAGNYGVYTYPGSGATYAPFETYTPLTFAEPAGPSAQATVAAVSQATGATVDVQATGLGSITGVYAAIIEKGTEAALGMDGGYVVFALPFPTVTDGETSFRVIAETANLDRAKKYEVLIWRQHTAPDTDTIFARADVTLTEAQWNTLFPGTKPPTPPTTPEKPVTPGTPAASGSLRWAISSNFTNYITGTASGSIAVSGGATRANGLFQFGQATGSTFDATAGTGSVTYLGSVRFTGHAGVLDVTVSNPQIRANSTSSASLYVTSGGSQVHFATLNLAAATKTTANGAVTYAGAPATLTSAGVGQVLGGFSTALDPVTFTVGAAGFAPSGSSGTVASAPARTSASIPATPPATTGIELDAETLAALESGEQVEISVPGFQPNEEGIRVVVYSTPIVLGEVTADATGTATWKGSLPATLADGAHTLTFQGSVDRGIAFTLARTTVLDGCVVQDASLRWGYKETFRTYIEGIAAGGWELTDVVYEYPEYVWADGEGTLDIETRTGLISFGGSIRFTGHDGALDTTLSNARIELAGDKGYLVFDITGETQGGEQVEQEGVRFVEFVVPDLEVTDEGVILDAVPTTLTDAGSAAFGTYPAGEVFDAVSAVLPVGACGATAPVSDGAVAAPEQAEPEAITPIDAGDSAPVWPWALGGLALVIVIGAVTWIVVARRRAAA